MYNKKYIDIDNDIQSILDEYLREIKEKVYKLEKMLLNAGEQIDYIVIKRIVHNIKGSAGSYGINIVSDIFQKFEEIIKYFEEINIKILSTTLIDDLLKYLDITKEIFNRIDNRDYDINDLIPDYENLKKIDELVNNNKQKKK